MDLKNSARLCRLCLCSSRQFIDVMEENGDLGFVVAKTIEDLLQFKVRKIGNYPWLACSTCLEKLIDFKLFKSRCIDSNITFEKRFCHVAGAYESENEGQEMPNAGDNVEEEDRLEEEDEVADVNKMCQALTGVKPTVPEWHNYNEGKPNMILCYTRKSEPLDSWERNSEERKEEIDIEEGVRLNIKEEPQDVQEDEPTYPPEDRALSRKPTTRRQRNVLLRSRLVERHFIEKLPPTRKKSAPQRRCKVCSARGKRRDTVYWCPDCEVPGTCGVDSVPADSTGTLSNEPRKRVCGGMEAAACIKVHPCKERPKKPAGEDHCSGEDFYCVFCSAVLNTEKHLRDHIAEHEEERLRNQKAQKLQPPKENVEVVIVDSLNVSGKACDNLKNITRLSGNDSYRCKRCFKVYQTYRAFKDHKSECETNFKCAQCKKDFVSQSYLLKHIKGNKSANVSCPNCSMRFIYRCALKAHRRIAHAKVFVCKDCHCSFDKYYHLREHILTHCKVKPLVCKDCQQTFIGSSNLRKHRVDAHNGRSSSVT